MISRPLFSIWVHLCPLEGDQSRDPRVSDPGKRLGLSKTRVGLLSNKALNNFFHRRAISKKKGICKDGICCIQVTITSKIIV